MANQQELRLDIDILTIWGVILGAKSADFFSVRDPPLDGHYQNTFVRFLMMLA